ncbi:hypothetical protein EMIT091MI3_20212 [Kosakonia quasisacchari]
MKFKSSCRVSDEPNGKGHSASLFKTSLKTISSRDDLRKRNVNLCQQMPFLCQ